MHRGFVLVESADILHRDMLDKRFVVRLVAGTSAVVAAVVVVVQPVQLVVLQVQVVPEQEVRAPVELVREEPELQVLELVQQKLLGLQVQEALVRVVRAQVAQGSPELHQLLQIPLLLEQQNHLKEQVEHLLAFPRLHQYCFGGCYFLRS